MKKLEIIIPHERLEKANDVLEKFGGGGMSFYHVNGRGKTKWKPVPVGRGVIMHTPTYGSRTKIEVIVGDKLSNDIINELIKQLTRGSVSDGKIFVYDVSQAYDIGSGQKNEDAI